MYDYTFYDKTWSVRFTNYNQMDVSKTRGQGGGLSFLKEYYFRVRVRVDTNPNTNLTLILTQTLKQHFV